MRSSRAILFLLFLLGFLFLLSGGYAKTPEVSFIPGEGPVDIEADELIYEREEQIIQAHGRVIVSRGNLSPRADHDRLNQATDEVTAWEMWT